MEETNDQDNSNLTNATNSHFVTSEQLNENSNAQKVEPIVYHNLNELQIENIDLSVEKILPHNYIKFLSYNISLGSPIGQNHNLYNDIRGTTFAKDLSKFDLVCLQAISSTFSDQQLNIIQEACKQSFFFSVSSQSPCALSSFTAENGLLILSRFPIEKYAFFPFNDTIYNDSLIQKGFLYAKIRIKQSSLHIINVSLQSNEYCNKKEDINQVFTNTSQIRRNQLKEIFDFIREGIFNNTKVFQKGDQVILCGNLNIDKNGYKFLNNQNIKKELTKEYEEIMDIDPNIVLYDSFENDNRATYGELDDDSQKYDTTLTFEPFQKSKMILDYIFEVEQRTEMKRKINHINFRIKKNSHNIEKFLISYPPLVQISDHYGLSLEIEYIESGPLIDEEKQEISPEEVPDELKKIIN